MVCLIFFVHVNVCGFRLIEELMIYNLYSKWCQTMKLWFPLTGIVFFENSWIEEYGSVFENPDGRHTSVYTVRM